MNDLISRQAAIERIESEYKQWGDEYGITDVLKDLDDMPSAQPLERCVATIVFDEEKLKESINEAIVRCKDCKHWDELLNMCGRTGRQALGVNGFCSRAERRTDG